MTHPSVYTYICYSSTITSNECVWIGASNWGNRNTNTFRWAVDHKNYKGPFLSDTYTNFGLGEVIYNAQE